MPCYGSNQISLFTDRGNAKALARSFQVCHSVSTQGVVRNALLDINLQ